MSLSDCLTVAEEMAGVKELGVEAGETLQLGSGMRKQFQLEEGTAFTNHGSYGAVPRSVMEERCRLLNKVRITRDCAVTAVTAAGGEPPGPLVPHRAAAAVRAGQAGGG